MYIFMCADYRRAMMDVLEDREEQVSVSRVMEGGVGAERWRSCVAVGVAHFSYSKHSFRPG